MSMSLFNEGKCSCCGKTFIMSDPTQWIYRIEHNHKVKVFCSWSCMMKTKKELEERKNGKDKDRV